MRMEHNNRVSTIGSIIKQGTNLIINKKSNNFKVYCLGRFVIGSLKTSTICHKVYMPRKDTLNQNKKSISNIKAIKSKTHTKNVNLDNNNCRFSLGGNPSLGIKNLRSISTILFNLLKTFPEDELTNSGFRSIPAIKVPVITPSISKNFAHWSSFILSNSFRLVF